MHPSITKKTYEEIYRMLDAVSPLDGDCGRLCGAACCTAGSEEDEMGIYLLPGEEMMFGQEQDWVEKSCDKAEDYVFPDSWHGAVWFIRCKTPPHCPRERRPIQCRSFPLLPHLTAEGVLSMVYNDIDTPYSCPLIEEEIPLNEGFVEQTKKAWEMLIRDPLIYDLVRMDSIAREDAARELAEKLFG